MGFCSRWTTCFFLLAALVGCSSLSSRMETAQELAKAANFQAYDVRGGAFVLRIFSRVNDPGAPLRVYIEGDGLAWLSRTRISPDPTPDDPIGLRLAAADRSPNVVYVARPCQYLGRKINPRCDERYWTSHRFAPEVIDSVGNVIDEVKARSKLKRVELVGFSGGAAVASLAAAGRVDVSNLRTVAGNLDHVILNRKKGVTPLIGSLNPADVASKLADLPQVHFLGGDDGVIEPYVAESFVRHAGKQTCIRLINVPGASHTKGWDERWRRLIEAFEPMCR